MGSMSKKSRCLPSKTGRTVSRKFCESMPMVRNTMAKSRFSFCSFLIMSKNSGNIRWYSALFEGSPAGMVFGGSLNPFELCIHLVLTVDSRVGQAFQIQVKKLSINAAWLFVDKAACFFLELSSVIRRSDKLFLQILKIGDCVRLICRSVLLGPFAQPNPSICLFLAPHSRGQKMVHSFFNCDVASWQSASNLNCIVLVEVKNQFSKCLCELIIEHVNFSVVSKL
ncbi:hypothetical protein BpHYR1_037308 [Brachionus plicatilis]|uniref:Uncharacterized protein n=1 Tax=Brachionus plicatilis TaxID=10195 RepID=A0A3M7RY85_BRAPC|nr:hypothetical protein BpHYR1_037308 [Brachionus plicatilis]